MSRRIIENDTYISISCEKINLNYLFDFLEDPSHGAISTFIGRVRNFNLNKNVLAVSYDVFEPLAIQSFREICDRAKSQFNKNLKIFIEHYKGRLDIGGVSVAIGVSSIHRAEVIEACSYIIEEIKHNSPIWKQEHYENFSSEWVKGHALCARDKVVRNFARNYELYCNK